jgi:hypothetical protein
MLALVSGATTVVPAAARTHKAASTHTLIVAVETNLVPAVERKLAVLVQIRQNGGAPAGAVATSSNPLTVLLDNRGLYRVRVEIDSSCTGSCDATSRISGSADHEVELIPSCQRKSSGFVCSKLEIVKVY